MAPAREAGGAEAGEALAQAVRAAARRSAPSGSDAATPEYALEALVERIDA